MEWIGVIAIVAVVIVSILRKKPNVETSRHAPQLVPSFKPDQGFAADDVVAVLMAAVAEFEGSSDFRVLSIRPSGNWKLTARQELLHGRI